MDTRDCGTCTCVANGLGCQFPGTSAVGDFASDSQCSGSSNAVPESSGCGSYPEGSSSTVNMKLVNTTVTPDGTPECTAQGGGLVGAVTKGQAVTFCCLSLE